MRTKNIFAILFAVIILSFALTGCAGSPTAAPSSAAPNPPAAASPGANPPAPAQQSETVNTDETEEAATFIFTDASGREVELPTNIERITPSGPLAQIVLYTLVPDLLVGLSQDLSETQLEFMDDRFRDLPVFGHFDHGTLNLESVMLASPQVIIDIGTVSPNSADDLQDVNDRTGIPTIIIHMEDFASMISGYTILGDILDAQEQAGRLISYIEEKIIPVVEIAAEIPESERVSVFFGQHDGLAAVIDGTIHSDVIYFAGGINVADIEQTIRGGLAEISMEQLMLWDPDVILFAPGEIYGTVPSQPEWSHLRAIREGRYFEVPLGPYNWMGRPPSVNRLIGVRWLANLLYPDIFPFDMAQETRDFYKLFYHHDVTDDQIEMLLGRSSFK